MTPGEVVVFGKGRKTVTPDGRVSTKRGETYTWLACDVCGEEILTKGLAPDRERLADPEYRAKFHRCRLTPRCPGYHVKGWLDG